MNSAGWNSTFGLGNSAFCGGNNIHDNEDDDMSNVLIKKDQSHERRGRVNILKFPYF